MSDRIRHVLFDFGGTLAREPFCVIAPPGVPTWEASVLAVYAEPGLSDRWNVGDMEFADVVARVAAGCGIDLDRTRDAMLHDWRNLWFNPTVLAFAREMGRLGVGAIVTVNPSIFTDFIVPNYGLDRDFSVIVTSWQERQLDKTTLCEIALDRLRAPGALGTALLVDNRADNVEAFRRRGGQSYLFTDDASFADDLAAIRRRLA